MSLTSFRVPVLSADAAAMSIRERRAAASSPHPVNADLPDASTETISAVNSQVSIRNTRQNI